MATHSCSCLEDPRDGGAWWAAVYGVAQSQARLKRLSSSSSRHDECPSQLPEIRWAKGTGWGAPQVSATLLFHRSVISRSLLRFMHTESMMPPNHLILCHSLLLLPLIFLSIRVFSNDSSSSHQVAKVLEFQLQHQSFQWVFRVGFL